MKFKYLILILLCVAYIFTTTGCEAQPSAYNGSVKGVIVDNSVTKPSNFTAQPVVENTQTSLNIKNNNPSYYTGKAYYNGEEVDDSVVKNYIISSAATFDFDVLNNVGDVVAIEDSKINVFINNVVHKTTDNKLIKSINSLNDSKVYVKIDTPNYGKQIWYLTIQKDRRVEEDFDVTFTF